MAWEWSHTPEAYAAAYANIHKLSRARLLEILREWAYHDREERGVNPSFRLTFNARKLSKSELADLVWARMEEYRTCDNGGFNAYACPDGCHTVSFDGDGEEEY